MSADPYANAIVMKTAPIIMKTNRQQLPKGQLSVLPQESPNPLIGSKGNPDNINATALETQRHSEEYKQILEREKAIEELLRQYNTQTNIAIQNGTETAESAQNKSVAVDFFLKMVKTYFALVLKFGDTVANAVIRMTMPAQIADPIISGAPLNIAELVKTADRVNQVLANPEFKTELGYMFENTSNAVNPQIKMLLNKMADIFMDVAGKTGSKLASTAAISLSAFPPLAVAFDIANLISVGVNAMTSGVSAVSTAANSGAKVVSAYNSIPKVDLNKYMANTIEKKDNTNPKGNPVPSAKAGPKVGGGLKEVGTEFLHDIGGDFIIDAGDKMRNAFYNISDTIRPEIDKVKLKVLRYTLSREDFKKQVGGAKRTRRAVGRIRKTLRAFTK